MTDRVDTSQMGDGQECGIGKLTCYAGQVKLICYLGILIMQKVIRWVLGKAEDFANGAQGNVGKSPFGGSGLARLCFFRKGMGWVGTHDTTMHPTNLESWKRWHWSKESRHCLCMACERCERCPSWDEGRGNGALKLKSDAFSSNIKNCYTRRRTKVQNKATNWSSMLIWKLWKSQDNTRWWADHYYWKLFNIISTPDDTPPIDGNIQGGGCFVSQSTVNTEGTSGKSVAQATGALNPRRATPYNKGSGRGAIRRQRNRAHRSEISQNRYSHLLSDLRVAEFIQEMASIEANEPPVSMRDTRSSPSKETFQPFADSVGRSEIPKVPDFDSQKTNDIAECRLEYYPPEITKEGKCRIIITPEDLKLSAQASCNLPSELEVVYPSTTHNGSRVTKLPVFYQWKPPLCSHCVVFCHNVQQCKHKPPLAGKVVSTATPGTPTQIGQISGNEVPIAPSSKMNPSAPSVDEDGFTVVYKHNKRGPIKLQSKKTKADNQKGETPLAKQHATRVEINKDPSVAPIASKKATTRFNYSRAVQGGKGNSTQQRDVAPLMAKPSVPCVSTNSPVRLVQGGGPSKPSIDLGFESANRFSVLDIPNSIRLNKLTEVQDDLYPPDNGLADSMDLEINNLNSNGNVDYSTNGKYGISDAQKQVILNCIRDFKYVQAEAVEEWSQGEWDFFADKCMEVGLDPENSIIYPDEDTEIDDGEDIDGFDSAHAVSHLKKLGSYVDPVVMKSPNRK
ncbi:hypothetical protein L1987_64525 [Smallanthus sonchifolius]|uniref:Uncharacterized protein n=1 Tax=Smallanthus sonchifolius TaxID=185202 RepID=A0ACB9BRX1_9ASTR|nr:hypothetical protein L1987_64525 [Smallanthus sonchifolius]